MALRKDAASRNIGRAVFELTALTGDYLQHYEKRAQIQWERRHESLERLLRLPSLIGTEQEPRLAVLRANQLDSGATFARLVAVAATEQALGERSGVSVALEQRLVAQLLIRSQTMATAAFQLASQSEAEVRNATRRAVGLAILLGASIVIMVSGTWLIIALRVAKPFRDLGQGIQILAGGNLDHRIGAGGRDEIGEVVRSIDEMAENLKTTTISRDELEQRVEERTAELVAANQGLKRSNAELEQFAYVASHDLQEPLRMVTSYTQLLARRYKGKLDADADEFIGFAVDGATRMQRLINDLLAYSRVGSKDGEFKPTDCSAVLERAGANLHVPIEESGAAVTSDALPTVTADESQLVQLFQNLIGNAVKFRGKKPPRIHVGAARGNGEWKFSVRDNGIGVDPQFAERIFVIFQRLHGRDEYSGTGMGLAICKKIVERHGGRIWVESTPGQGSTFRFTLSA